MEAQRIVFILCCFSSYLIVQNVAGVEILSKSRLEKCEKGSDSDALNCTSKIVLNMAVPSSSSGGEALIVAEIAEVEENSTSEMKTLRIRPRITINKSSAYALYDLSYIRDVAYKPKEYSVQTRKCRYDAGANVVQICERLGDENGHIIPYTEPTCCPCGSKRRVASSCGNFFDRMIKGKANTAHCVRFPGDWFHVFGIGQRVIGFSVRIEVETRHKVLEVIVGPENRTSMSKDNFLRVNLVGDFVGYSSLPSFENFYLVIPRQGGSGQPQDLGRNFSMWMLLEKDKFTLDGVDCDKIGVSYEAFKRQPNFCSSPVLSCLHDQLWNFKEADQIRMARKQIPLYSVEGRFERINQHPNAGTHSFSIRITEVLNSNLLIELAADDIEFVSHRSPGKILNISIPTFETLTQIGEATITTKNTGEVEASYSLTLNCSKGVSPMEEQFFIMKPNGVATRTFKLNPSTDQAAKYVCEAILKDSNFNEVDRAECQFSTTATIFDNGSQVAPFQPPKDGNIGLMKSIKNYLTKIWEGLVDFIMGKACRWKCTGFFDFSCHIQHICISWMVLLFGLLLAIFATVWLLHQKGLFDPLYDWWEYHVSDGHRARRNIGIHHHHHRNVREGRNHGLGARHHRHNGHHKRRSTHQEPNFSGRETAYHHYLHHVHKDKSKHRISKKSRAKQHGKEKKVYKDHLED